MDPVYLLALSVLSFFFLYLGRQWQSMNLLYLSGLILFVLGGFLYSGGLTSYPPVTSYNYTQAPDNNSYSYSNYSYAGGLLRSCTITFSTVPSDPVCLEWAQHAYPESDCRHLIVDQPKECRTSYTITEYAAHTEPVIAVTRSSDPVVSKSWVQGVIENDYFSKALAALAVIFGLYIFTLPLLGFKNTRV